MRFRPLGYCLDWRFSMGEIKEESIFIKDIKKLLGIYRSPQCQNLSMESQFIIRGYSMRTIERPSKNIWMKKKLATGPIIPILCIFKKHGVARVFRRAPSPGQKNIQKIISLCRSLPN